MKKLNKIAWLLIAILSLLVGIIVVISEGTLHSKFYVFFLLSPAAFYFWYLERDKARKSSGKKKKS
ncbi:MAG: hypothetical protein EP332_03205 [Bacteroidetes bacterium]|nr:MAG: hypothetical protein EP332_03205 [Bacteroidota bacterium]